MSTQRLHRYAHLFAGASWFAVVSLCVWSGAFPVSACAAGLDDRILFNIPAQPLESALLRFSQQASVQLLTSSDELPSTQSNEVSGRLAVRAALAALLQGTGLTFTVVRDGTIAIRPANASSPGTVATEQASPLRLAQAEQELERSGPPSGSEMARPADLDRIALDEIVVVASRLGAPTTESAQPVKLITREDIDRSGASSVAQVLSSLSEVSINAGGTISQSFLGASTVQLRGLPLGTSLVLINGRRIGSTGATASQGFFDLNAIPLAVVDHVEVLPSGSSAVYGGDALGGVVNIVLKKGFDGAEGSLRYAGADGQDDTNASASLGHAWSRGSLSIIGSYARITELQGFERSLTASSDRRPFGGPDQSVTSTNPGNIYSRSGNLPGLSSSFAAVPAGSTGVGLTPADFAGTAGTLNRDSSTKGHYSYIPPQERYGALVYGTFELTPSIELFSEVLYTNNGVQQRTNVPSLSGGQSGAWIVPAANAFNPFGVNVGVDFAFEGADRWCFCFENEYFRPLVGGRGDLGSWNWEVAGWMSRDWAEYNFTQQINRAAVNSALASSNPATALNVFQDGPGGSPDLINSLFTTTDFEYYAGVSAANAFIRGPLLQLPSGTVQTLVGIEYERVVVDPRRTVGTSGPHFTRETQSVFTEAKIPLLAGGGDSRSRDLLALSLAARYDDYSDFGTEVTPGVGLEFRPSSSLLLRASYSSAFKPPLLAQLRGTPAVSGSTISDPERGGETYRVDAACCGNPGLDPQTGVSKTLGIVLSPASIQDFRILLTYWSFRIEDGPTIPTAQYMVDNAQFYPGRVTRDASGRISFLDLTYINFGYIDESGFDFSVDWKWRTRIGTFAPSLSVTNTQEYEVQAVAGAPATNSLGQATFIAFAPRWKGVARLGWESEYAHASLSGRYTGEYRDYAPSQDGTVRRLGDFWYLDANVRFDLDSLIGLGSNGTGGMHLSLGAVNLLDKLPDYSNNTIHGENFDPLQYDLRGRILYAEVGVRF